MFVQGFVPIRKILQKFHYLDSTYNRNTTFRRVYGTQKRSDEERSRLAPSIEGAIHRHFITSFPRLCFLEKVTPCSGRIIHAHAIQEAQLRVYAKDGKVYFPNPRAERSEGLTDFKLLGVNRATTFTGFCTGHDNSIFRPIETVPFIGNPEQVFLYHYRALCKDYYVRLVSKSFFKKMITEFERLNLADQVNYIRNLDAMNELDLSEINMGKPWLDESIKTQSYGALSGCWMRGSGVPGVLATTNLFPPRDLLGRPIPNRKSSRLENWISLTITIESGLPLVLIAGPKTSALLQQLLESIRDTPQVQLSAALCRFALAYSEHFVIIPKWWEGLEKGARRAARLTFNSRYYSDYFKGPFDWTFEKPVFF